MRVCSNETYDAKLIEKGIQYKRIGTYTTTLTPIEHKCLICDTVVIKPPKSVLRGSGCAVCSTKKLRYTNAIYDDKIKFSTLKRVGEYISNKTPLEHKCSVCGYEYKVVPASIIRGIGCIKCSGKLKYTNSTYDDKLLEKGITHKRIGEYINSATPIEHECATCGNVWAAAPSKILFGRGCPVCAGTIKDTGDSYDAKLLNKGILHKRIGEYVSSKVLIDHQCNKCTNIWKISPNNALKGHGCPVCAGTLKYTDETYDAKLLEKGITHKRLDTYINISTPITHKCATCNHEWKATPKNIIYGLTGCPVCAKAQTTSKAEKELGEYIQSIYSGWIEFSDRSILNGKELDIVLPDLGLAFEYNGVYWHQEDIKGKDYHSNKTTAVENFGYQLIHINEDEWQNKQSIVKSRIKALLGFSTKIYARKCAVREVELVEAVKFLTTNHIQGTCNAKFRYGLYLEDNLTALMTFGTPRFTNNYTYELLRYCSVLDHTVIGGASRLLKAFRTLHQGSIISYADKRWSKGNLYSKLGFTFSHDSAPNYRYYKGVDSLSRQQCQKHKLVEQGYDPKLTEKEIMKERGYHAVYDSGNSVWVLE